MRLFTTRARRPDRPPAVRSLDLAALAAGRGSVTVEPAGRDAASSAVVIASALSLASGVSVRLAPTPAPVGPRSADALELVASCGHRSLAIELGPDARRAWLGLVLGLPAGQPAAADLAEAPSPLERSVLARTLVEPVARARWGRDFSRRSKIELEVRRGRESRGDADLTAFRLIASGPAGPVDLALLLAEPPVARPFHPHLDRAIRSAPLPFVAALDPERAGVTLRAADLVRCEPGDVVLTDLPADEPGGLPVVLGVRAGVRSPSQGRGSPDFPRSMPSGAALKGRLGNSGDRRGVRVEASGPGHDVIH